MKDNWRDRVACPHKGDCAERSAGGDRTTTLHFGSLGAPDTDHRCALLVMINHGISLAFAK
ncbi:MAG: hypothetical protein KME57_22670 [Scytonema hyalinum WJT4-NPBG1]|nr:hypothetical protein [Scytonema hyalinum WJT4-NPBG1]